MTITYSGKELELRNILLRFINGSKKEKEKLLLEIYQGEIKLNEYNDIVNREGYNRTYKDAYFRLKGEVSKYYAEREEEAKKNNAEEQEAKKIIYSNKDLNGDAYYYSYSLKQLEELLNKILLYIDNKNVSENTKNNLKGIKKDISNLIENIHKKENFVEEQTLKSIADKYNSGKEQEIFEDMMNNEHKYSKYSDSSNVSVSTKKRYAIIRKKFLEYKKEYQAKEIIKKIAYLSKIDSNVYGEYKKYYNDFYDTCLKYFRERDLSEIISAEDKENIEKIIVDVKKQRIEEEKLRARGYGAETLNVLRELLNKYKNNQSIYVTAKKVGSGTKTLSKFGISLYLIKFENEKMLSEEDLKYYKEFAQEYGLELLSWIILGKNISETKEENSIEFNEIMEKYFSDYSNIDYFYHNRNALKYLIDKLLERIKKDDSLYREEKEKINERAQKFYNQFEEIKIKKYLDNNNMDRNFVKLLQLINNEQFLNSREIEELDKYEDYLRKTMETSNLPALKEAYNKVKTRNNQLKKDANKKKCSSIYQAIKYNFINMTNKMINGAEFVNGKLRPFDYIDYIKTTSLSFDELENPKELNLLPFLNAKQRTAWNQFKANNNSNYSRKKEVFLTDSILKNAKIREVTHIINGKERTFIEKIEGTGEEITAEEKAFMEKYARSLKVPFNEKVYYAIVQRYINGYIPNDALVIEVTHQTGEDETGTMEKIKR